MDDELSTQNSAADVASFYQLLLKTETVQDTLDAIAGRAAERVGLHCGITVRGVGDEAFTVGSSDQVAAELDEMQYAEGDGPCLEALRTSTRITVEDMAHESRWGAYPAHAVEVGARGSVSFPMVAPSGTIGALNLYAVETPAVGTDATSAGADLAEHAAGALAVALRFAETAKVTTDLRAALSSRTTIDHAIGILMAQQRCSPEEGFALLRRASQGRNVKLRDIAAQIVAGVGAPPAGAGAPSPAPPRPAA